LIGGALCLVCATEAAGLYIFSDAPRAYDFALAVTVALAFAAALSFLTAGLDSLFKRERNSLIEASAVAGFLSALFFLLLLELKPFVYSRGRGSFIAVPGTFLFILVFILGGVGMKRWLAGKASSSSAPCFAFSSALCTGVISVAASGMTDRNLASLLMVCAVLVSLISYTLSSGLLRGRNFTGLFWGIVIVAATGLSALTAAALEYHRTHRPATASPDSPPVILLTVDTLRADYAYSSEGKRVGMTPLSESGFNGLAKDGISFINAAAPSSWTPTSVSSIITGLPPSACGAGKLIPGEPYDYTGPLESAVTLAEVFRDAGYATAAFVDSAWLYPARGFAQGFDTYVLLDDFTARPRHIFSRAWEVIAALFGPPDKMPAGRLTDLAIEWIKDRPDGPFFLWVHYYDPHLPYYSHPRYPARADAAPMAARLALNHSPAEVRSDYFGLTDEDREYFRQLYNGEVRYTEDQASRFLHALRSEGLYNMSVIGFAADHGEELWDHGGFEHGHGFHSEILHVPLVVKTRGNQAAGAKLLQYVSVSRLGATLLHAAGLRSRLPGQSLLSCLREDDCGAQSGLDLFWFAEGTLYGRERGAVGDLAGHKAVFHADGSYTCYFLPEDPKERSPLPESECPWPKGPRPAEVFDSFRQKNLERFASLGGHQKKYKPVTGGALQHLKALGYIK